MSDSTNYSPWQITDDQYPQGDLSAQIRFLINYAILAPNSHNTQPWKFHVEGQSLRILPDLTRSLSYSDRTHRELYLSLGCALANILAAATHFQLQPRIDYLPEDEISTTAVRIHFTRRKFQSPLNKLFPYLTSRRTNRGRFSHRPLPPEISSRLINSNHESGITVHLVSSPDLIVRIGKIMYDAAAFAFSDQIFKAELSRWVISNISSRPDGMPLSGFGIPLIPSLFAPQIIRNMPAFIQAKMDQDWVLSSSALIIITGTSDDKLHWLKTGKAYEILALTASSVGLATAPMAAIIEHPPSNSKVQKLLKTTFKPLFYARLGYPRQLAPHSPRRSLSEVLV